MNDQQSKILACVDYFNRAAKTSAGSIQVGRFSREPMDICGTLH
jgi:hypothetical protein